MLLDRLPAELLHHVCSYCSAAEIRNLRLTSRLVSAVADEHFLPHVTIFYLREDFETIEAIVKNPRIAAGIRSVRFQADRLQFPGSDHKTWKGLRKHVAKSGVLKPPDDLDEGRQQMDIDTRGRRQRRREAVKAGVSQTGVLSAKHAKTAYMRLYSDQHDMTMENRAQLCMKRLFSACSKLNSVEIVMRQDVPDRSVCDTRWYAVRAFRQIQLVPFKDDGTSAIMAQPTNEVLLAALQAGRKLRSLTLSPISHQLFSQKEVTMAKLYSAISNLEKIHICFDSCYQSDRDEARVVSRAREMEENGFSQEEINSAFKESFSDAARRVYGALEDGRVLRFLQHAPNLREISLRGPVRINIDKLLDVSKLLGLENAWGQLRDLRLHNVGCHWEQLIAVVLNHRDTLEHLSISMMKTTSEENETRFWPAVAGKLPKLKSLKLDFYALQTPGFGWWMRGAMAEFERYIITGQRTVPDLWDQ